MKRTFLSYLLLLLPFLGSSQTFLNSYNSAGSFASIGNVVLFAGSDYVRGAELWKTDGTREGTVLVKEIKPGSEGSAIAGLTAFKGKVYFSANDPIHGNELWMTDGTNAGTLLLKNINPNRIGSVYSGSNPGLFTVCNDWLYFTTYIGSETQLWKTDGTVTGTVKVYGGLYGGVKHIRSVGTKVYFTAEYYTGSLYVTDGTESGTKKLTVDEYTSFDQPVVIKGDLYFVKTEGYSRKCRLYKLNSVDEKFSLIKSFEATQYGSIDIGNICEVGQNIFFSVRIENDNADVDELWKTDGSTSGTSMVKSFPWDYHYSNSFMQNFVAFENKLYFSAGRDENLWYSDGTAAGTLQVSGVKYSKGKLPLTIGGKLFFNSAGKLFSLQGGAAKQVFATPSDLDLLIDFNEKVLFTTTKDYYTKELWNSAAAPLLSVTFGYQTIEAKSSFAMSSLKDSALIVPVKIKNDGALELQLSQIVTTGSGFYLDGSFSPTLSAGKEAAFNLIYFPGTEEIENGRLSINCNQSRDPFYVDLTGSVKGIAKGSNRLAATALLKSIKFADSLTNFSISRSDINEGEAPGSTVGSLSLNGSTTATYSLIDGFGSTDNGKFKVEGNLLKTQVTFNASIKNTYSIRLKASAASGTEEKIFTVKISAVQQNVTDVPCVEKVKSMDYSLNDVAYTSERIIAVGTRGKILVSENDGEDWTFLDAGVTSRLKRIVMFNKIGYVLGENCLLKSEDSGKSWYPLSMPDLTYPYLNGMYFYNENIGYLYGESKIYKTLNGGRTWKKLSAPAYDQQLSVWFINESEGFSCGRSQTLFRTRNGGESWEKINTESLGFNVSFVAITFTDNNTGYLLDNGGNVLQTTNGGTTWSKLSNVSGGSQITFLNKNTGYVLAGGMDVLHTTTDAGKTWTRENIAGPLMGFAAKPSGDRFCIVGWATNSSGGAHHKIYLKNGTSSIWKLRSGMSYNVDFSSVAFPDEKHGYIIGSGNYKTLDGGITWNELKIPSQAYYYAPGPAFFLNKDIGYCGAYPNVLKTSDGGETWSKLNVSITNNASKIFFHNEQKGLVISSNNLYFTSDGGNNWKESKLSGLSTATNLQFIDANVGYISSIGDKIYKTTDGGATWADIKVSNISVVLTTHFFDEQNGLLGATDGQLFKTTDGGKTWSEIQSPLIMNVYSFSFFDRLHGYVICTNYSNVIVFETFDGGETWVEATRFGGDVRRISITGSQAFAAGPSGLLVKMKSALQKPIVSAITGEPRSATHLRTKYSVYPTEGTSYTWSVSGDAAIEYYKNEIVVEWKKGGKYKVSVSPYNACSTGEARTIDVTVEDLGELKISGPSTVVRFAKNVSYSSLDTSKAYVWSVSGASDFVKSGNEVKVNWGSGPLGSVTLVEDLPGLNLKRATGIAISIVGAPAIVYKIAATSASCKGAANGAINIRPDKAGSYIAYMQSSHDSIKAVEFTDSTTIANLASGKYTVCVAPKQFETASMCYSVLVAEPQNLLVNSVVDQDRKQLSVELSGAENYKIDFNGKLFETSSSLIDLNLSPGKNTLRVYSDKPCQGVVEREYTLGEILLFPNPFSSELRIVHTGVEKFCSISVIDLNGRTVFFNQAALLSEPISLAKLNSGQYLIKITVGKETMTYKVNKI